MKSQQIGKQMKFEWDKNKEKVNIQNRHIIGGAANER
jgi:uncharacterized DUF497 family protein